MTEQVNATLFPEVGSKRACRCERGTFTVKDSNRSIDAELDTAPIGTIVMGRTG